MGVSSSRFLGEHHYPFNKLPQSHTFSTNIDYRDTEYILQYGEGEVTITVPDRDTIIFSFKSKTSAYILTYSYSQNMWTSSDPDRMSGTWNKDLSGNVRFDLTQHKSTTISEVADLQWTIRSVKSPGGPSVGYDIFVDINAVLTETSFSI